jgi:hypothetical protein
MRLAAITALTALIAAPASAAGPTPACRGSWNVVGACFALHGTLSLRPSAGASGPRIRIEDKAVRRTIGVLGLSYADRPDLLPPAIAALLQPDPLATEVEGDFTVCPLDRDIERESLRLVCIEDASHVVARKR